MSSKQKLETKTHLQQSFLGEALVDLRPVGDVLGPESIVQSAQSFLHGVKDGQQIFLLLKVKSKWII